LDLFFENKRGLFKREEMCFDAHFSEFHSAKKYFQTLGSFSLHHFGGWLFGSFLPSKRTRSQNKVTYSRNIYVVVEINLLRI